MKVLTSIRGIKTVTVVGSGLMGSGIAQVAASTGHTVRLNDISEPALITAQKGIEKSLKRVTKKMDAEKAEQFMSETLGRITYTSDIAAAATGTDLAVEAVVENLALKQKLFAQLEAAAPATAILATNTSSLPVTTIGENIADLSRFGGLHFFNPVPMMKLLEVIKCEHTSDATFDAMIAWGTKMGKVTVSCLDTPGFIVNRLLVPYCFEAMRLHERGHGSIKDIDTAMKLGAGYPMGPFELADYVGLDTMKLIIDGWHEAHPDEPLFEPTPKLVEMVEAGKFGRKSGEGFYNYKK